MNYFIVHSGTDYDAVTKAVKRLKKKVPQAEFIVFFERVVDWKSKAEEMIRRADKIIFFVNDNTYQKTNIEYELGHATNNGKEIYIYKLARTCKVSETMAEALNCDVNVETINNDKIQVFNKARMVISKIKRDVEEMCSAEILNITNNDRNELFQQYQMFVKTSEDLVKRKQTVNNLYVTLNSAILGIIIAISGLELTSSTLYVFSVKNFLLELTIKPVAAMVVAVFGILVCCSWITILKIYANLNSSKMSVIIAIEKQLPINLFETEWRYVSLKNKKGKYKSFSSSEKRIAVLFVIFYSCIILGAVFLICRQYF